MAKKETNNNASGWKVFAVFLSIILLAGIVAGVVFWRNGNIVFHPMDHEKEIAMEESLSGGMLISEGENNGVAMVRSVISKEEFGDYGVSESAESAYLLTATITPSNATDQTVSWSVAFADNASEWASGKTVTDYVTVTPTEDGALTAVVACMQSFGEQIIVNCASRDNADAYAICKVDYMQRLDPNSVSISFGTEQIIDPKNPSNSSYHVKFGIKPSIDDEESVKGGDMNLQYSMIDSNYTLEDSFFIQCYVNLPVDCDIGLIGSEYGDPDLYFANRNTVNAFNSSGGVAEHGLYFSLAWFAEKFDLKWMQGGSHGYTSKGEVFDAEERNEGYYADLFNSLIEDFRIISLYFSIQGTYSSYEKHIDVYLEVGGYSSGVTDVSLDDETIIC